MPVSKKRKKDGKPVAMAHEADAGSTHEHGPEEAAKVTPTFKAAKPANPFVAHQQAKRGAQRGR
jgi:hypothetical protein